MKKVLAVAIVVAFISIGASISDAQIPNAAVYFDDLLQNQQSDCVGIGVEDTIFVVFNNLNMFVTAVEYKVDFTGVAGSMLFLGDIQDLAFLYLGASNTGVSVSYPIPQAAFGPFIAMQMRVLWTCETCAAALPLAVVAHPESGAIGPEAVEYATFRLVDVVGMTSLICPGVVSTEETSWGRVKALYN